jgi:hypothetical protein
MECWHWCRGGGGHDWNHETKTGTEAIDNWRTYCPEHGSQIVKSLLGSTDDESTSGPQRRESSLEESPSDDHEIETRGGDNEFPFSFYDEGDLGNLGSTLAMALEAQKDFEDMSIL